MKLKDLVNGLASVQLHEAIAQIEEKRFVNDELKMYIVQTIAREPMRQKGNFVFANETVLLPHNALFMTKAAYLNMLLDLVHADKGLRQLYKTYYLGERSDQKNR